MGCFLTVATAILGIFFIRKIYKKVKALFKIPPLPKLENTWWGPGSKTEEDSSIQPFKINVSDEVLKDLQQRLSDARPFTPPLEGVQHQYGLNTKLLSEIVDFWRTKYDWRQREEFLNKFPQFTVKVQGLRLHYLHVKPTNSEGLKVLPLLLLHGWPGSVREFYEIVPLLTAPQSGRDFVFEVIVPSLPGYGFSEAAVRPGLGAVQVAVVFKNFMNRLGFEKYYIHGGDWGAVIVQNMATIFPDQVLGVHSTMFSGSSISTNIKIFLYSFWPSLFMDKIFESKLYPMGEKFWFKVLESGYMHLQATKPDTVGVALNDSPVGLAAYILEKFITWTDPELRNKQDGGLNEKYTYTNLLDNVMIYWVTNSITTSCRLYSETLSKAQTALGLSKIPITVPTAFARFSNEMSYLPGSILKEKFSNLVYESDSDGGHFAAFEVPKVLAEDIFSGVEKMVLYHKRNGSV